MKDWQGDAEFTTESQVSVVGNQVDGVAFDDASNEEDDQNTFLTTGDLDDAGNMLFLEEDTTRELV